jgi:outer membrane protein TolC
MLLVAGVPGARAQCVGRLSDLPEAARCTAHHDLPVLAGKVDPERAYALSELIGVAESSNPRTRIAWEQARQAAEATGAVRSEYLPHLAGLAVLGNEKFINPFPRPLAPHGYTMVENPSADAGLAVSYTILDFGRRHAALEHARAIELAAAGRFQRENQEVAFGVVTAYYRLVNAQETLTARGSILEMERATQAAAEAQLANGRATLPDVLDARAGTARAEYEMEAAIGEEQAARVNLREAVGVEPSDQIRIQRPADQNFSDMTDTISELVEIAQKDRPDLAALAERLRGSRENLKAAESTYWPTVEFAGRGSVQAIWPTVSKQDGSALADTTQFVWNTGVRIHWDFFDGGLRRSEVLTRASEQRQAAEELRARQDEITRETWMAFVQYKTALRQRQAARALLTAAESSYASSLDAYHYGVKSLIDLVHAESQLAEARLADVQARSALLTSAANLGYTTGTLLRQGQEQALSTEVPTK